MQSNSVCQFAFGIFKINFTYGLPLALSLLHFSKSKDKMDHIQNLPKSLALASSRCLASQNRIHTKPEDDGSLFIFD